MTPTPQQYAERQSKIMGKVQEQVRGTFGGDERFRDYKINAYKIQTPSLGPGSH